MKIAAFVREHDLDCGLNARLLDLASETGELSKEMLLATDYGKRPFELSDAFGLEFGDVLFALLCVANEANLDAEASLNAALKKYAARLSAA